MHRLAHHSPSLYHTTRGYIIKLTLKIIVAGWSICTYMILSQFLFEMLHSLLHFTVHTLSFFHSFDRQWQFSFLNLVDIEHDFFLNIRLLSFSSICELVFVRSWPILMPAIVIEKKSKTLKTKVFVCVLCLPVVCVCCNILESLDTWRRLVADLDGMAWRVRYTHSDPKWHDRRIDADLIGSFKGKCMCVFCWFDKLKFYLKMHSGLKLQKKRGNDFMAVIKLVRRKG